MIYLPDKTFHKTELLLLLDFDAWPPKALGKCTMLILEHRKTEMAKYTIAEVRLDQPQPIGVSAETEFISFSTNRQLVFSRKLLS